MEDDLPEVAGEGFILKPYDQFWANKNEYIFAKDRENAAEEGKEQEGH